MESRKIRVVDEHTSIDSFTVSKPVVPSAPHQNHPHFAEMVKAKKHDAKLAKMKLSRLVARLQLPFGARRHPWRGHEPIPDPLIHPLLPRSLIPDPRRDPPTSMIPIP